MIKSDSTENTAVVIKNINSGRRDDFKLIVEKYQRLVSHIVFRMVNDTSDREDLSQEIFLKVYKNLKSFRFESRFSTWIAKIAYNECINHIKKKRMILFSDQKEGVLNRVVDKNILPDEAIEKLENREIVLREINRLDVRYRVILTLYHIHGMRYREIGDVMNLPQGTVKSYLFRARRELKEALIERYRGDRLWRINI